MSTNQNTTPAWSYRKKEEWLEGAKMELECMLVWTQLLTARKAMLMAAMEHEEVFGKCVTYNDAQLNNILSEIGCKDLAKDDDARRELYRRLSVVLKKESNLKGTEISVTTNPVLAESIRQINATPRTRQEVAESIKAINHAYLANTENHITQANNSWDWVEPRRRR